MSKTVDVVVKIQDLLEESDLVWDIEYRPEGSYYVVRFGEADGKEDVE